jgi:hypothetical protein
MVFQQPASNIGYILALGILVATLVGPDAALGRDLSGVWQTRITGELVGESFLCQVVPNLDRTQVDTVRTATNLKELMQAIIPDSSRTWFDSVCEPAFHGAHGDSLTGACRIPAVYAKPCTLVGDLTFHGRLRSDDRFEGFGKGDVTLGGPGMCPKSSCPGELHIVATRIARLPAPAPRPR